MTAPDAAREQSVDSSVLVGGVLVGGGALATIVWFVLLRRGVAGHRQVGDGSPDPTRTLTEAARGDFHSTYGGGGDGMP